jgi:hypothetical protein
MELKVCPETSVNNYLPIYAVSIPEERRPHLHHGGTLKSLTKPTLTEVTLNTRTEGSVTVTPLYVTDRSSACVTHSEQSSGQEGLRVEIGWRVGLAPFCPTTPILCPLLPPDLETVAAKSWTGSCPQITRSNGAKQGRSHDVTAASLAARYLRIGWMFARSEGWRNG